MIAAWDAELGVAEDLVAQGLGEVANIITQIRWAVQPCNQSIFVGVQLS